METGFHAVGLTFFAYFAPFALSAAFGSCRHATRIALGRPGRWGVDMGTPLAHDPDHAEAMSR